LNLETLGIINGCIDAETQIPLYPAMAYNNTYGLQVINETEYEFGVQSWPACKKLIDDCRSLATEKDPAATGNNVEVNGACATAFDTCFKTIHDVYLSKNVSCYMLPRFLGRLIDIGCCSATILTLHNNIPIHSHQSGLQGTSTASPCNRT
jgi:hypothetical protein